MSAFKGVLEGQLTRLLEPPGQERYAISTAVSFATWRRDGDASIGEIMGRDPVVVVDARASQRQVVLQRIRGEIRYWLTVNSDPLTFRPAEQEAER